MACCVAPMRHAPVCPLSCFYTTLPMALSFTPNDLCIGCGYCCLTPARSARRNSEGRSIRPRGRWTNAPIAPVGPEDDSTPASTPIRRHRLAEGKLPICALECASTQVAARRRPSAIIADLPGRVMKRVTVSAHGLTTSYL